MAAAYAYHITGNHPFVDGNKRAGLQAALLFLELNGIAIHAKARELVEAGMALAQGRLRREELARFFRAHARPR